MEEASNASFTSFGRLTEGYPYYEAKDLVDSAIDRKFEIALSEASSLKDFCSVFVYGYDSHNGYNKNLNNAIIAFIPTPEDLSEIKKSLSLRKERSKRGWEHLLEILSLS